MSFNNCLFLASVACFLQDLQAQDLVHKKHNQSDFIKLASDLYLYLIQFEQNTAEHSKLEQLYKLLEKLEAWQR